MSILEHQILSHTIFQAQGHLLTIIAALGFPQCFHHKYGPSSNPISKTKLPSDITSHLPLCQLKSPQTLLTSQWKPVIFILDGIQDLIFSQNQTVLKWQHAEEAWGKMLPSLFFLCIYFKCCWQVWS